MAHNTENRFTDREMEIAKNTDLPDLLTHLGYQVKRIGSYHTTGEMDSLRIKNRRTWFRYSQNVGGDAISFLQHFHNKSFPEAVEYLLAYRHMEPHQFQCTHVPAVRRGTVELCNVWSHLLEY